MAKVHLISNLKGDFIGPDKPKKTYKQKEVVMPQSIKDYMLARDRIIWKTTKDPETIKALKEKYNV